MCGVERSKQLPVNLSDLKVFSVIANMAVNTYSDSDVISKPAGFRRHLVGKTLINVFHCDISEIRVVGKLMIIRTFS